MPVEIIVQITCIASLFIACDQALGPKELTVPNMLRCLQGPLVATPCCLQCAGKKLGLQGVPNQFSNNLPASGSAAEIGGISARRSRIARYPTMRKQVLSERHT